MVAFLARHHRVQTKQWELRKIVIECNPLPPSGFAVARFAFTAEFPLMRIVLFVAGHTSHSELILIEIAAMTAIAFGFGVLAAKRKFRLLAVFKTDHIPFF